LLTNSIAASSGSLWLFASFIGLISRKSTQEPKCRSGNRV
jgi:hypothetical protein